jgi:hypothetical protein
VVILCRVFYVCSTSVCVCNEWTSQTLTDTGVHRLRSLLSGLCYIDFNFQQRSNSVRWVILFSIKSNFLALYVIQSSHIPSYSFRNSNIVFILSILVCGTP